MCCAAEADRFPSSAAACMLLLLLSPLSAWFKIHVFNSKLNKCRNNQLAELEKILLVGFTFTQC